MMTRRRGHEPVRMESTRTSFTWVAVGVAVVFLVLLIVFIAQNDRQVPLHFLGASGTVSEALALIAAALAGAVCVLAIGTARIVQLRLVGRRHNRALARQVSTDSGTAAPPASEAQAVQPDH